MACRVNRVSTDFFVVLNQSLHGFEGRLIQIHPDVVLATLHLPARHRTVSHHRHDAPIEAQVEPLPDESVVLLVHLVDDAA